MPDMLRESGLVQILLAEEARGVARVALEGRFGMLDADLLQTLVKADRATLKDLMRHFSSESLEQVRVRLGAGHGQEQTWVVARLTRRA